MKNYGFKFAFIFWGTGKTEEEARHYAVENIIDSLARGHLADDVECVAVEDEEDEDGQNER